MSTWILVLMVSSYSGISTTPIEFPTEMGCTEAGKKVIDELGDYKWNARFVCVEKK